MDFSSNSYQESLIDTVYVAKQKDSLKKTVKMYSTYWFSILSSLGILNWYWKHGLTIWLTEKKLFIFVQSSLIFNFIITMNLWLKISTRLNKTFVVINTPCRHDTAKPVAWRYHEVSGSLALLFWCCEVSKDSRAAAGDKVLSVLQSVHPPIHPKGYEGQIEGFEGQLEGSECQLEGSKGQLKGYKGQLEASEGLLGGSEGLPTGSEGQREGSEGLLEGPEGLLEGLECLPEGCEGQP